MTKTVRDLQDILFTEIDNIINSSSKNEGDFRRATARNSAVNETARTIIQAGDLVLRATVEASTASRTNRELDSGVVYKLTGISDENTKARIEVSTGKQDQAELGTGS